MTPSAMIGFEPNTGGAQSIGGGSAIGGAAAIAGGPGQKPEQKLFLPGQNLIGIARRRGKGQPGRGSHRSQSGDQGRIFGLRLIDQYVDADAARFHIVNRRQCTRQHRAIERRAFAEFGQRLVIIGDQTMRLSCSNNRSALFWKRRSVKRRARLRWRSHIPAKRQYDSGDEDDQRRDQPYRPDLPQIAASVSCQSVLSTDSAIFPQAIYVRAAEAHRPPRAGVVPAEIGNGLKPHDHLLGVSEAACREAGGLLCHERSPASRNRLKQDRIQPFYAFAAGPPTVGSDIILLRWDIHRRKVESAQSLGKPIHHQMIAEVGERMAKGR